MKTSGASDTNILPGCNADCLAVVFDREAVVTAMHNKPSDVHMTYGRFTAIKVLEPRFILSCYAERSIANDAAV